MKQLMVLVSILLLVGCTWVKLTEAGEGVSMINQGTAADCKVVAKVTAISRAKVAGISRKEQKLALELQTIARNEAATMGGNAVKAAGDISGNEQVFNVYDCP